MDRWHGKKVQITKVIDNNQIKFEGGEHWYWSYKKSHFTKKIRKEDMSYLITLLKKLNIK